MIKINNVTKKYGNQTILDHISCTFPNHGLVCITGASGSGKTTLLNLLGGFDSEYEGEIELGGHTLKNLPQDELCGFRREHIGFIFQSYHLLSGYTVLENLLLPSGLSEKNRKQYEEKAKELLNRLGIAGKVNEKIENLSGGQKQRAAIARALLSEPSILLADEPTGALDRTASTEIMELLKTISEERLVILITHDPKICSYADEWLQMDSGKLTCAAPRPQAEEARLKKPKKQYSLSLFPHALKNFRVHSKRCLAVSLAISIGMLAFLFSLSYRNDTKNSIENFQKKNSAYTNGYIEGADDGTILRLLQEDERIETAYYQYKLEQISLISNGITEIMAEKLPLPKTSESLSYGTMPRRGQNEIALTPSLAKKFAADIKTLVGTKLKLEFETENYELVICGIYNAGYDDFFVSSDVEQQLYKKLNNPDIYSTSYDVKNFDMITEVNNTLLQNGITAVNAAEEASSLQSAFKSLGTLFFLLSACILGVAVAVCAVLILKLQNSRSREIGLLSALGFRRSHISRILTEENLLLSSSAAGACLLLLTLVSLFTKLLSIPFHVTPLQIIFSLAAVFITILTAGSCASHRLVHMDTAAALRS